MIKLDEFHERLVETDHKFNLIRSLSKKENIVVSNPSILL